MFDEIFATIAISLLGLCSIMLLIAGIALSPFLWLDVICFSMMFGMIALCYFGIRIIWD